MPTAPDTAEPARGSLAEGAERALRFRAGLDSAFPAGIGDLRVSFFGDGGSETLELSG
ncbi:hypothetical protein [Streptomyces atroolivaceus]|uniref:hypothetical protein n=1 Tax=Streptomyces atroolivaceus TaxID=66869 RepID=UPI00202593A6|nr:hypothetical protein [Streptomyces atroolivaceus]